MKGDCFLPHFTPAQEIKHTEPEKPATCFFGTKVENIAKFYYSNKKKKGCTLVQTVPATHHSTRAGHWKSGLLIYFGDEFVAVSSLLWSIFFLSVTLVAYQHISVVQTWTSQQYQHVHKNPESRVSTCSAFSRRQIQIYCRWVSALLSTP